jgi:hypothetical protein
MKICILACLLALGFTASTNAEPPQSDYFLMHLEITSRDPNQTPNIDILIIARYMRHEVNLVAPDDSPSTLEDAGNTQFNSFIPTASVDGHVYSYSLEIRNNSAVKIFLSCSTADIRAQTLYSTVSTPEEGMVLEANTSLEGSYLSSGPETKIEDHTCWLYTWDTLKKVWGKIDSIFVPLFLPPPGSTFYTNPVAFG